MMDEQQPAILLKSWEFFHDENGVMRLYGILPGAGYDRCDVDVITSPVMRIDGELVTTKSGSVYKLG